MPEVKTLQFLNTPEGQAWKNQALVQHLQAGWRIVSETVTPGHMKGNQACCLAMICLPLGFAAGRTEGVISVTLQRRGDVVSANHSAKVTTSFSPSAASAAGTKPLSQNSRRVLLGLLGLFAVVFVFGLFQKGKSPQVAKNKKEESKAVTPAPPKVHLHRCRPPNILRVGLKYYRMKVWRSLRRSVIPASSTCADGKSVAISTTNTV
jgi:hypothetical protein